MFSVLTHNVAADKSHSKSNSEPDFVTANARFYIAGYTFSKIFINTWLWFLFQPVQLLRKSIINLFYL